MSPVFSPAVASDIDQLIPLMRQYYAFDHLIFDESNARAVLHEMMNSPHLGKIYTITINEELQGYAVLVFIHSLEFHGRAAFLDEFFLREEMRGRGIGKIALEFLFEECRKIEIKALRLEVTRGNSVAKKLYSSMGFEEQERNIMTKKVRSEK